MKKNIKYKTYKENKIKVLLTKTKRLFKKNDRAFNMLKKGLETKEPVINSRIHRSIK